MEREELNYRVLDEISRVEDEIKDLQYELAELIEMCDLHSVPTEYMQRISEKGE